VKRFYNSVSVGEDFSILLDGKPIKTPAKSLLVTPTRRLAEAIADEWRSQVTYVVPSKMLLTKLANTAIDRAEALRDDIATELIGFGKCDLLCYRAIEPVELIQRQQEGWDRQLDWLQATLGARLKTRHGVGYIEQDSEAVAALDQFVHTQGVWTLTGLQTATTITGSLVLALAMAEGRLTPAEAFALSRIDESFQAEKWGLDVDAEERARLHAIELERAGKFIELARA
jgi:chaperone required for assembly of F1-ATPase